MHYNWVGIAVWKTCMYEWQKMFKNINTMQIKILKNLNFYYAINDAKMFQNNVSINITLKKTN